jgi:hypothetical protein
MWIQGRVDYRGLKESPRDLNAFLSSAAALPSGIYKTCTQEEKIAFWLNVYNACTRRVIIDHYPIHGSFFRRREFDEPGIHMALACAARSCPPLRQEPYTGPAGDVCFPYEFTHIADATARIDIHPYPTQSEALRQAASQYYVRKFSPRLKRWLGYWFRWRR